MLVHYKFFQFCFETIASQTQLCTESSGLENDTGGESNLMCTVFVLVKYMTWVIYIFEWLSSVVGGRVSLFTLDWYRGCLNVGLIWAQWCVLFCVTYFYNRQKEH